MRTPSKAVLVLSALTMALGLAAPASAQVKNLKFQSTWPASSTIQDNFR